MPPMRDPEHDEDPQYIAENLGEENARLYHWIDSEVERFAAICGRAADVRAQAHDLVDDASRQGATRQSREQHLDRARESVHSESGKPPTTEPTWVYLVFEANPALRNDSHGRKRVPLFNTWDSWVEASEHWQQIDDEAKNLIASASDQYGRREEARAAAERAVEWMDETVEHALGRSATCFRDGQTARPAKASTVPLAAFLLVALAGIPIAPTPIAGWIAFAFLFVVVALSVVSTVRGDHRAISIATLTAGSSLAFFTAAYLVVRISHPDDLLRSGKPISSIAEAAFTSLTVGVTGGTIGTDLGGAARIVAFIQILLTVGAVASGIAWAWRRLIDRSDDQGTPTPHVETNK